MGWGHGFPSPPPDRVAQASAGPLDLFSQILAYQVRPPDISSLSSVHPTYIIYTYIYMYRKLRGLNREICFCFVSCSCRACERAGEAKLRERVWGMLLNAGDSAGHISGSSSGVISPLHSFCCYLQGF